MRYPKFVSVLAVVVACMFGALTGSVVAPSSGAAAGDQADAQFIEMMIPHHYQAIIMSQLAPDRSTDDQVRNLADRIKVEQGAEIKSMQGWQGRQGLSVTDPQKAYQEMLQDPEHLKEMGMATAEQIEDLRAARGNDFDVLFLQLMIPHHQAAIDMSVDIVGTTQDEYVYQTAMDIIDSQSTQVDIMQDMLDRKT